MILCHAGAVEGETDAGRASVRAVLRDDAGRWRRRRGRRQQLGLDVSAARRAANAGRRRVGVRRPLDVEEQRRQICTRRTQEKHRGLKRITVVVPVRSKRRVPHPQTADNFHRE